MPSPVLAARELEPIGFSGVWFIWKVDFDVRGLTQQILRVSTLGPRGAVITRPFTVESRGQRLNARVFSVFVLYTLMLQDICEHVQDGHRTPQGAGSDWV